MAKVDVNVPADKDDLSMEFRMNRRAVTEPVQPEAELSFVDPEVIHKS